MAPPRVTDPGRPVGPLALLALGVNGIVGVGIFFIPATVGGLVPGTRGVLVFAVTGLCLVPVALAFASLGRRFDEDGGPVVFARAAFGELPSFLVGWLAYVSAVLSASAVMVGLTRAAAPALGLATRSGQRFAVTALVTLLAVVVASGISVSARAWTTLTVLKLLPLVALAALAPAAARWDWTEGEGSFARAALTVLFAYQGFEIVPVIAGQVRASARSVPFATVGSLVLACILYVVVMGACVAALPGLAYSRAPLAEAAGVLGGGGLRRLVEIGTSLSALGICLGMMVTTPRYLCALASGGRELCGLHRFARRGVPLRALAVTWALVTAIVQAGDLSALFALSSLAVLSQYGATAASLFVLAVRRERGLRPSHALLALPVLAFALVLGAQGATAKEGLASAVAFALGLALFAFSRPRSAVR